MTNLKNHFIEFSENWENYVRDCMYLSEGNNVYLTKDHPVYQLLIETIVNELESHVDKRRKKKVFKEGEVTILYLGSYISTSITRSCKLSYFKKVSKKN